MKSSFVLAYHLLMAIFVQANATDENVVRTANGEVKGEKRVSEIDQQEYYILSVCPSNGFHVLQDNRFQIL